MSIQNIEIGKHLRGDDGGFITEGTGLWIHSFDEWEDGAWTVEVKNSLSKNKDIVMDWG